MPSVRIAGRPEMAQDSRFACLQIDCPRNLAEPLPLIDVRTHLPLDEASDRLRDGFMTLTVERGAGSPVVE